MKISKSRFENIIHESINSVLSEDVIDVFDSEQILKNRKLRYPNRRELVELINIDKKRALFESYGINSEVIEESNNIYKQIIEKHKKEIDKFDYDVNLKYVEGNFESEIFGENIKIYYKIYKIPTLDKFKESLDKIDFTCGFDSDGRVINIISYRSCGTIDLELKSKIAHELSHVYDFVKFDSGLYGSKEFEKWLYKITVNSLSFVGKMNDSTEKNIISSVLASIYLSFQTEQRAYANQLHSYYKNSIIYGDVIDDSHLYLLDLRKSKGYLIESPEEICYLIKYIFKIVGTIKDEKYLEKINPEWLKSRIDGAHKRYLRIIGRIEMEKAEKDGEKLISHKF